MNNLIYNWLEFKIDLPSLEKILKESYPSYTGNSANTQLTLHFSEAISEEMQADIDTYIQSLTEADEKVKMDLAADLEKAVVLAKVGILTASFDSLIPAERKILMGLVLSDDDRLALKIKYLGE